MKTLAKTTTTLQKKPPSGQPTIVSTRPFVM